MLYAAVVISLLFTPLTVASSPPQFIANLLENLSPFRCDLRSPHWSPAAQTFFQRYYNYSSPPCSSHFTLSSNVTSSQAALRDYAAALGRKVLTRVERDQANVTWLENAHMLNGWTYSTEFQACTLEAATIIRSNNQVYARAAVTNHNVLEIAPGGERVVVSGFASSTGLVGDLDISYVDGELPPTVTGGILPDIPALRSVLKETDSSITEAEATIQVANLVTLALPSVLALVPADFIGVDGLAEIVYVIATDVVAVLPTLLKGLELIQAAKEVGKVVGFHVGSEKEGILEVWAVRCSAGEFSVWGWGMLVFGLMVMVVGIFAEVWSRKRRVTGQVDTKLELHKEI